MKHTLQSLFLYRVAPYLSNDILPKISYKVIIQSPHSDTVYQSTSYPFPNHVLQTFSTNRGRRKPPALLQDFNFPTPLILLQSSHSYRKRIELNSNTLCPSCRKEQHATVHNFSCPSHPTSLTKKDIRERPSLSFEFLFGFHFFYLPSLPPPELPPSNRLLN